MDSNPHHRRNWYLKPAPYTARPRYRRKASGSLLYCSQIINSSKQCNYSPKRKTYFPGSGGIRTHAPEETGALNQRLRPLGHATVERSLVRSFTAHKLLILQNNVTILLKAKRISLAAVGFEPTPRRDWCHRPLGHATVERPLVRSFTAHKLLILQNNVTILLKVKRISLAAVGFEPTPPKRLVP
ncbi:hypothetical protein TNCT_427041 [Trichonephila clavata]|uniref:Uncharacterized protein n=1 Tax=Trichonephila clavata TaxID=2740835 RepID=A0A8X6LIP9_TRICU|nr:hypothetical protein TNCT_427041 [Trichonephila clavata]